MSCGFIKFSHCQSQHRGGKLTFFRCKVTLLIEHGQPNTFSTCCYSSCIVIASTKQSIPNLTCWWPTSIQHNTWFQIQQPAHNKEKTCSTSATGSACWVLMLSCHLRHSSGLRFLPPLHPLSPLAWLGSCLTFSNPQDTIVAIRSNHRVSDTAQICLKN